MEVLTAYLEGIADPQHRERMKALFTWIFENFPELSARIAWNQPMFTHHGTFIIGFSIAKHHMSVAPEQAGMEKFSEEIEKSGYKYGKQLFRIPWDAPVDYPLLEKIIAFNISDKADCSTFWRK